MRQDEKSPAMQGNEFDGSGDRFKDSKYLIQSKRVFKAFFGPPRSMLEIAASTGIMRSNITWYVNDWLKAKAIQRVRTGFCSITSRKVGKYSTNPMYWKKEKGVENAG